MSVDFRTSSFCLEKEDDEVEDVMTLRLFLNTLAASRPSSLMVSCKISGTN